MPSANGVYSLPAGYLAVTGAIIQASQHNPPLEDIAQALTLRLSRDGTAAMTGSLQAVPGAANDPSYTFSTDNSTGFFKTNNGIGVAIGGTKSAEFTAAGISGSRVVGELVPFSGSTAPSIAWVFPFGQTLSRTTYADLWAFAQIEIAAGNTFYNNGDGSTTFGIGDMRGRLPIGWDKMGGSAAGRLTTAGGGVDGTILGTAGGGQTQTLTLAQLPTGITSSGNNSISVSGTLPSVDVGISGSSTGGGGFPLNMVTAQGTSFSASGSNSIAVTSNNTSGNAHPIIPPVLVTNYILFTGRSA